MDIEAARQPGSGASDIKARADVFSIDARTLANLRELEQTAATARITRPGDFRPYDDPYTCLLYTSPSPRD